MYNKGIFIVKVVKWGNSLGLRIPNTLAQAVNIENGTEVEIMVHANQTLAIRSVEKKPTLEELLAKITPENKHNETDWGKSEGNECN